MILGYCHNDKTEKMGMKKPYLAGVRAMKRPTLTLPDPADVEGKEREIVRGSIAIKKSL